MKTAVQNLTKTVDKLGAVKAEIADLEIVEKGLRDKLAESGVTEAEGKLFRATVSTFEKIKVDYRAVIEKLQAILTDCGEDKLGSAKAAEAVLSTITKLLKSNTTVAEQVTVKVVSR